MSGLSRRQLSSYMASELQAGNHQVVQQVAAYLVASRRTKEADLLVRDVEKALSGYGVVVAHLKSAYPMDESEKLTIEKLLADRFQAKEVITSEEIDANLLGGVLVQAVDGEFDGSLRRNINRLKAIKA